MLSYTKRWQELDLDKFMDLNKMIHLQFSQSI